jgi:hypothetical protein
VGLLVGLHSALFLFVLSIPQSIATIILPYVLVTHSDSVVGQVPTPMAGKLGGYPLQWWVVGRGVGRVPTPMAGKLGGYPL